MLDYDTLGYCRRTYFEHGHTHTEVKIMHGRLVDVRALLAGTWDNRAGYGTEEAAERLGARYRDYLRQGIVTVFQEGMYSPYLRATFLHYQAPSDFPDHPGYCEPSIWIGEKVDTITRNLPLLRKVGPKRTKGSYERYPATPEALIARFPKAIELHETARDGFGMWSDYYVPQSAAHAVRGAA